MWTTLASNSEAVPTVPVPSAGAPGPAGLGRQTPPREAPLPAAPLRMEAHMSAGVATARVGMLIFSDFQCPYCASFATDTLPTIRRDFVDSGKVRMGFHHFPLEAVREVTITGQGSRQSARNGH